MRVQLHPKEDPRPPPHPAPRCPPQHTHTPSTILLETFTRSPLHEKSNLNSLQRHSGPDESASLCPQLQLLPSPHNPHIPVRLTSVPLSSLSDPSHTLLTRHGSLSHCPWDKLLLIIQDPGQTAHPLRSHLNFLRKNYRTLTCICVSVFPGDCPP